MSNQAWIAIIIFFISYGFIISEKIHRTIIAMLGAAALLFLGVLDQKTAIHFIDFNTIGLLIGMMILVSLLSKTGVFQFLAIWSAQKVKGRPLALLIALSLLTAIGSAFLDNVTTVLLIVPMTFSIAKRLGILPTPFLISEVFMSNIGGTATMIGDPPNIMIGSAVPTLSFLDFITNLAPVIGIVAAATLLFLSLIFRHALHATEEAREKLQQLHAADELRDKKLMIQSLAVLGLTITAFFFHGTLHVETATIALTGAFFLLLLTGEQHLAQALAAVEWPTLFFFIGLFLLVGGLVQTGVIRMLAAEAVSWTGGRPLPTALLVLWFSAFASAFVDNIPYVATMIPLIQDMGKMGLENMEPIWWSLSLGACLGGNGLLIGASANLVVAGLAAQKGHRITFFSFMKIGMPVMLLSIVISSIYIVLRYFLL
ncbi:SLC13 family permease [Sporolactobacillus spathodeae]|uniref:Na+/H+ antiporter NhaD/arsenite permease-like protein n=1 Tax=Sporolactobacillus spathodeae TaxID=1465502 RepID=A0ABS2QB90_9BACL|nr:Na+/H+ antiporter NhaD/arsenite permease-like protein [Sporolactobacillus spathodeae]